MPFRLLARRPSRGLYVLTAYIHMILFYGERGRRETVGGVYIDKARLREATNYLGSQ